MPVNPSNYILTNHLRRRMSRRWISADALVAVLAYGRTAHVRGAKIHVIGRKEVNRYRRQGIELDSFEGIHVVCTSTEEVVLTAYRNRNLRGLRPKSRHRHPRPHDPPESQFRPILHH